MKKQTFSKKLLSKIRTEAKRYAGCGLVVYFYPKNGIYGYHARLYSFPGEFSKKGRGPNSENFGKFRKAQFFAKHNFSTWEEAAKSGREWWWAEASERERAKWLEKQPELAKKWGYV